MIKNLIFTTKTLQGKQERISCENFVYREFRVAVTIQGLGPKKSFDVTEIN